MKQKQRTLLASAGIGIALLLAGCPVATTGVGNSGDKDNTPEIKDQVVGSLHEGTISQDETWTKAKNPHVIHGNLYVESSSGTTLTIEPGAIVKFEQGASLSLGYNGNGILKAEGTATESITFTSAASSPARGNWDSIWLGKGGDSSKLKYCTIQYGGSSENQGALRISNSKPSVEHCTFDQNSNFAIALDQDASFTTFEGNLVKNTNKNPIKISANSVGALSLGQGNSFTDNGADAVYVVGGTVDKSARWRNFGIPYQIMEANVSVAGNPAPELTIDPGCVLQFGQGRGLEVAWNGGVGGTLKAVGLDDSATGSITFTSTAKNPAKGDWEQIAIGPGSANSVLSFCKVLYGGSDQDTGALRVYGINCKPSINNCQIDSSAGYGVFLESEASFSSFLNNKVDNCGKQPIKIESNAVGSLGAGNAFVGNSPNAILVYGETFAKDALWRKYSNTDYWISNSIFVDGVSSPVLTIEPGCTLKFASACELSIGRGEGGALYAVGTTAAPITFTGMSSSKGYWQGITIDGHAADGVEGNARTSQLKNVVIEYGGGESSDEHANLYLYNSKPLLDNASLVIRNSSSLGLYVYGDPAESVDEQSSFDGIVFSGNDLSNIRYYP
ncbi:MAG TPA: hypothetical protein DD435_09085 [Cyanobacteria bacterium UBA8530]|nr:hypothetical protein [Cyanobacteria bacterium UBA8530]